jgi:hypothetical protein
MANLSSSWLGLVSAGIDWITLTATDSTICRAMGEFFDNVAANDKRLGYATVRGGAYGFYGWKARHGLLGRKDDRSMLQVSSEAAKTAYVLAYEGGHCTRLDIQVTLRVAPGQVQAMLARLEAEVRSHKPVRGLRPKVKSINGDNGPETILVGRRASDVYMRLYDKFEESKEEQYRDTVRLELELKGKAAQGIWEKVRKHGNQHKYLLGVLKAYLARRGVSVEEIPFDADVQAIPPKEKTSLERTIGWLAKGVAPSVAKLAFEWGWQTAFNVVFGNVLTQFDRSAILNAWSRAWGS